MTDTSLQDRVASKAVAVAAGDNKPTIYDYVNKQRDQVALALPKGMDADRFTRLVITQVRQTPALANCTPTSLLGALMLSAQLGLEPGPLGHVWLIPRNVKGVNEVSWQLGYKGIIELARRSGQLSSIEAHEVCEADEFDFNYGLEPTLTHKPAIRGDRGPAYAYYAVAKFKDGGNAFVVLSKADIDKRRNRSAAKSSGPWTTDYDAMARKTCIRALAPYLPLSAELERQIAADEKVFNVVTPNMVDDQPAYHDVVDIEGEEVPPDQAPPPAETPLSPDEQKARAAEAREQLAPKQEPAKRARNGKAKEADTPVLQRVQAYANRLQIDEAGIAGITGGSSIDQLDDRDLIALEQAIADIEQGRAYLKPVDGGGYRYTVGQPEPPDGDQLL